MKNSETDFEKQLLFILELEKLKGVLRKTKPLGTNRYENSAEHSWHICLAALTFAPYADEAIDLNKVLRLLLVHDIAEIDTGDTIVFSKSNETGSEEQQAIERIFGILPENQRDAFIELCGEFLANETKEAKFVHAMDRVGVKTKFQKNKFWKRLLF